ncbi:MAG TPA: phosphoribosyltransferase family protein [Candidatus Dormibacteraeota bacterium]|nr:phosphoribosyltransferase family protein [Candidatus Dormibacteraeota bacterium]
MDGFSHSRDNGDVAVERPPELPFQDRRTAGRHLAARLARRAAAPDPLVLGLARGGVPVAAEVALALHAPLDVYVVRKLGVPGHEELALGAVASGGVRVLNRQVLAAFGISAGEVRTLTERALAEVREHEAAYRAGRPPLSPAGRTAILVDDGLATGATMRAAVQAVRAVGPRRVVVAVPVAPSEVCHALRAEADEVVCAATPEPFTAVGRWYADFHPVSADEVRRAL